MFKFQTVQIPEGYIEEDIVKTNPVENVAFNNDPVYELYGNIDSIDIIRVQKTEYIKTKYKN